MQTVLLIIGICITGLIRYFLVWTQDYALYSIPVSWIENVFVALFEYNLLKRWVKNHKLLKIIIIVESLIFTVIYMVKILFDQGII